MSETNPDQTKISLVLSPALLHRFDDAIEKELHERDNRSLKLRTLIREYCDRMKV